MLIPLGFLAASGAGGAAYYLQMLASQVEFSENITVDANDDFYVVGRSQYLSAGSYDLLLVKFNAAGIIQWQRVLGGASIEYGTGVTIDSSGYIVVVGYTGSTGAGGDDVLIAKYDSSGTIQWQRTLGHTGLDEGRSIATDSSDNIYLVGFTAAPGGGLFDILVAKYNSVGSLLWQKLLGLGDYEFGEGITVNSIGEIFVVGQSGSVGAGGRDAILVKYNSSGVVQWQRALGGSSNELNNEVTTDTSGNIYVTGSTASAGTVSNALLIAKYNSSGTLQWQRILGGAVNNPGYSIALDVSNNVYVVGDHTNTNPQSLIAKYDSSGTIQWQRRIDINKLGRLMSILRVMFICLEAQEQVEELGECFLLTYLKTAA